MRKEAHDSIVSVPFSLLISPRDVYRVPTVSAFDDLGVVRGHCRDDANR